MLAYKQTLDEIKEVIFLLKKYKIIRELNGRLLKYIKIASSIDNSWTSEEKSIFQKKYKNPDVIFAIKELVELKDIFKMSLSIYDSLSENSKKHLGIKIRRVLAGPNFPVDENNKNNSARNYQFELRLASRFIFSGYRKIEYGENPDFSIKTNGRTYAFECKRVFGLSDRSLITNTLAAIKQLININNCYAGIVALDISPQYEKGRNWVNSKSEFSLDNYLSSELKRYIFNLNNRVKKLEITAIEGKVVALILNLSAVYTINFTEKLGVLDRSTILAFNRESSKANNFIFDFASLGDLEMWGK